MAAREWHGVETMARDLSEFLRQHEREVLHLLYCGACDLRCAVLHSLALAGLSEDEFVQEVWDALVRNPES